MLEIDDLSRQEFLDREMALVKVQFRPEELNQLTQTAEVFGARVIAHGQADHHVRDRRRGGAGRRLHQRLEFLRHSRPGPQRPRGA